jgi:hypothetical protein
MAELDLRTRLESKDNDLNLIKYEIDRCVHSDSLHTPQTMKHEFEKACVAIHASCLVG